VSLLGLALLGERPSSQQWLGVGVALLGTLIYFYPVRIPAGQVIGLVVGVVGLAANSVSAVLGRQVNRGGEVRPLTVTVVSMGVGATLLLTAGLLAQGLPPLTLRHWAMIGWLAVVNTAFAFTLWNMSQRTLTAMESSVINNTMSVQIPLLAVLFLGETLSGRGLLGLAVTGVGTLLVQFGRRGRGVSSEQ
jgi:drug/metabolite transporter (DMT)-like permease